MRHFDAWLLRDPYSIFHYYSSGHRWKETIRDLIQERKICSPPLDITASSSNGNTASQTPINPYARPINSQSTSPVIAKLPLEIRLMIYEYAFGDQVIHLVQVKDKIRHVRCKNTTSSLDKNRRCCPVTPARWRADDFNNGNTTSSSASDDNQSAATAAAATSMLYPHTHPSLPSSLSNSSTSLLRTCRTIYAEASDLLYRNSTFDVDDLTTFIAFTMSISPLHLRQIRRLSVQWTPVWQPMAGEEHKSSIYSHTHNDRLWATFWNRVAALEGLEELTLSVDLGRFAGSPVPGAGNLNNNPNAAANGNGNGQGHGHGHGAGGLIGGHRLRLSIQEPWVAPLLCVRGLRSFELGITARCDAAAKSFLEGGLVRDAVLLRDQLRVVMCSDRGSGFPVLPGVEGLEVQMELARRCAFACQEDEGESVRGGRVRPRLAITAA
ncbi:hypothetical protein BJX61DRAFT_538525 [Aspergillus egyptiacus]|nr:hypothetical protein BJX61DRAFT_538525 [Aspergillus egyptiacus]